MSEQSGDGISNTGSWLPPAPSAERLAAAEVYWRKNADDGGELATRRIAKRASQVVKLLPPMLAWASFESPELPSRVRRKAAIAEAKGSVGAPRVVFAGSAGAGKTSLAGALARAWYLQRGEAFAFVAAWHLAIARSRHPLGHGEPEIVTRALAAELLVLDDLGSEKPTHGSAVDEVIFERHWQGKATWVTTAWMPDKIAERYGDNIARRVFEHAVVIDCEGT